MNVLWLAGGAILGLINIGTQWWTVNHLHPEASNQGLIWVIGGFALRWLFVAAVFIAALQYGAISALLVFGGFWVTRWIMLGWITISEVPPGSDP